jgi:type II secretory pathway pseudopilin PulG
MDIQQIIKDNKEGFTLAELLVAMSVFIIVTVVAVGAFIQSLKSERHLVAMIAVDNDVGTALEQMARDIRTGYLFATSTDPSQALSFYNASGDLTTYGTSSTNILVRDGVAITSNNVIVKKLDFIVTQTGGRACYPWRVTINLGIGAAGADQSVAPTYIQTTMSSRVLPKDVPPKFKYNSAQISGCN